MRLSRIVVSTLSLVVMLFSSSIVHCQDFPSKPIRIIAAETGGGVDFASRLIAQGLTATLGQQVIVENRGGGSGTFAAQTVAKAPPDGYTLLMYGATIWLAPFMRDTVPYDPVKDFSPITLAVSLPHMIIVHPSLPAKSVKELIALAKSRPGQLSDGSTSTGSPTHLAAELFKVMAGVNILRVPYKGTGPALNALLGGQVQLMFSVVTSGLPHVKSGRLKALAVTSAQPSLLAPGLPTVAASGVPGFESGSMYGIFAPAKTPAALINRLNQEIVRVLALPDVKDKFFKAGVETVGSSPGELAALVKSDMAKFGKLIRDAGIREES